MSTQFTGPGWTPPATAPPTPADTRYAYSEEVGSYDLADYVEPNDPNGDATAALNDLGTKLAARGGGVIYARGGSFYWGGQVIIPSTVDIVGVGQLGTNFVATSANANFLFGATGDGTETVSNYGNVSGGFRLWGSGIANELMTLGLATARTFRGIWLQAAAGTGLRLAQSQNNAFINVNSLSNLGSNMVLDWGAGGNWFGKCESYRGGRYNLELLASGTPAVGYEVNGHNTFDTCLFEGTTATTLGSVHIGGGTKTVFASSHLSLMDHGALYGTNIPVFSMAKDSGVAAHVSNRAEFVGACGINGSLDGATRYGYGVDVYNSPGQPNVSNVYLGPDTFIDSCNTALRAADTSWIYNDGVAFGTNTIEFANLSGGVAAYGALVYGRKGRTVTRNRDAASTIHEWQDAAGATAASLSNGGSFTAVGALSGTLARTSTRGTVGAPAHTFTNDLDTGVYSPGVDQLGLASGANANILTNGAQMAFFGKAPVTRPVAVPVTTADIHAALVTLGLIT